MEKDQGFSFGENWKKFLKTFNEERLSIAADSLREFLHADDLSGKVFVDVGCGSGLFSYAAFVLRAERVVSFDVDPQSVECCKRLRAMAGDPANWEVLDGSILDRDFIGSLGTFDIVYSWGVLHHTGRMWEALNNATDMVKPGGLLYIALYNKILSRTSGTSWIHDFWIRVKKTYNAHPWLGYLFLELPAMAAYIALVAARLENPITHVRNYRSNRGMSWRTDATDWLGGWPYEFATVEEVFKAVRAHDPRFQLINLKVTSGRGLNWYLFEKSPGGNDDILQ